MAACFSSRGRKPTQPSQGRIKVMATGDSINTMCLLTTRVHHSWAIPVKPQGPHLINRKQANPTRRTHYNVTQLSHVLPKMPNSPVTQTEELIQIKGDLRDLTTKMQYRILNGKGFLLWLLRPSWGTLSRVCIL